MRWFAVVTVSGDCLTLQANARDCDGYDTEEQAVDALHKSVREQYVDAIRKTDELRRHMETIGRLVQERDQYNLEIHGEDGQLSKAVGPRRG